MTLKMCTHFRCSSALGLDFPEPGGSREASLSCSSQVGVGADTRLEQAPKGCLSKCLVSLPDGIDQNFEGSRVFAMNGQWDS